MGKIQVMLVDDHQLVRSGMRRMLEEYEDIEVITECGTGEEALERIREVKPDVVLMDINMPGIGGLEATQRMVARDAGVKVVGLSMHINEPYPSRLLSAGAVGFLGKDATAEEVVQAIRKVMSGEIYITPSVAGQMAVNMVKGKEQNPFDALSQREMQVMLMITRGKPNSEISETLNLSPKTVSTYRSRLFEKLDVTNNVELIRMGMRYGVLSMDSED